MEMNDDQIWKTFDSKYVYQNNWIKVREDHYETPSGKIGLYGVVESGSYAMIIPKIGNSYVLVETYRYILQSYSVEFPAGGLEEGEIAEDAARRELLEETGLISPKLRKIGFYYSANGLTNDACHLFLAEDCVQSGGQQLEDVEEGTRAITFTEAEIAHKIKSGEITDGPTIAAYSLYQLNR